MWLAVGLLEDISTYLLTYLRDSTETGQKRDPVFLGSFWKPNTPKHDISKPLPILHWYAFSEPEMAEV